MNEMKKYRVETNYMHKKWITQFRMRVWVFCTLVVVKLNKKIEIHMNFCL